MAKLSDRQKDNIRALFKTGYYSKNSIAKRYKVDEKTIRRIIKDNSTPFKRIVKLGIEIEKQLQALPASELKAVRQAIAVKMKML